MKMTIEVEVTYYRDLEDEVTIYRLVKGEYTDHFSVIYNPKNDYLNVMDSDVANDWLQADYIREITEEEAFVEMV